MHSHHANTDGFAPSIKNVLIASAFLRLSSIMIARSFQHPQTWEFGPLAENIVKGLGYSDLMENGTYQPSIYMPPGYPYFLSFFFRIGGTGPATFLFIEIVQASLGVLLVYLVYHLGLILIGKREAIVAACLVAFYPAQIYLCNEFHSINLYIVLEVGVVLLLVRNSEASRSWKNVLAAGVCMGLLMLFRGETPALMLLYTVILFLRVGLKGATQAMVFALVASACLAPWTIRNYSVFGRFVPVCSSGGLSLWVGNNPLATGDDRYPAADIVRGNFLRGEVLPYELEQLPSEVRNAFSRIPIDRNSQIAKDEILKHLAVDFIRTHPKDETILSLKKIFAFFVFDTRHEKGRQPMYWLPSILLSLLAIWGAVLRGKRILLQDLPLVASILFAVAVGVVVFVLPRYKIVIDPFIMIFAATGLSRLFGSKRSSGASPKSVIHFVSPSR